MKKEITVIKKKYRDDRRTVIVNAPEDISVVKSKEDRKIEKYVVGMNANGLIRRVKLATYKRYSGNAAPNKAELFLFKTEAESDDYIYAFTNKGDC